MTAPLFVQGQGQIPENLRGFDYRKLHFGFLLSLNTSDFFIDYHPSYTFDDRLLSIDNRSQGGFNLAFLASLDMHKNVRLRFIPGISTQDRVLAYRFLDSDGRVETELMRTESFYLDIPLNLKFRTNRINNFAAYALAGGKFSLDMQSQKDVSDEGDIIKLKRQDYSLDFGGGVDFFLPYFKLGFEAKAAIGLPDVLIQENHRFSAPIQSLRTRAVIITMTIEG